MTRRKDPEPETAPELVEPLPEAPVPEPDLPPVPDEVAPDPVPDPALPPPAPLPRRSGGFLGPVLGGALAAVSGFALSHYNVFGLQAPDTGADIVALSGKLDEALASQTKAIEGIGTEIAAQGTRLTALETAPAPAAADLSRLDALDQRLAAIEAMPSDGTGSNAALAAKLAELERRLAALPATAPASDLQAQLDAALSRLDAAEAAATDRAAKAEAAATTAQRAQKLDSLSAAVAEGRPFAQELNALADPALTSALQSLADTGVPTLAALQADFPDAARQALQIARQISTEDGWSDRLVDFLASQTGARPLTPQEGTTPDAILSRAEFALSEGRVADALAELDPLDPAVKAPLDDWIAAAGRHLAAVTAVQAAGGE